MGYVGQGERLRPLIHALNVTVAENKRISYIAENINDIHEYIQTKMQEIKMKPKIIVYIIH